MAASVVVLCLNARRLNVKVTPNTSILQILEEACSKQNLNSNDYELVYQRKVLDLSLTVRFANLTNNALLELRPCQSNRRESMVTVCMQTESAGRLVHDFAPAATLYDVLDHWIQQRGQSALRGNAGEDTEPVCLYMRREVVGEHMLRETSLRSLGLTGGNAVIRLFYRVPETLRTQAHVETLQLRPNVSESTPERLNETCVVKKSSPAHSQEELVDTVSCASAADSTVHVVKKSNPDHFQEGVLDTVYCPSAAATTAVEGIVQREDEITNMEVREEEEEEEAQNILENFHNVPSGITDVPDLLESSDTKHIENEMVDPKPSCSQMIVEDSTNESEEIIYVGDRDAVLYNARNITSHIIENLPDDFYELTVEDARYLYASLQNQRREMDNEELTTKSYKQAKKIERMLRFKNTILRIQFPNQLIIQAKFSTLEKVSSVMEFIRQFLVDKNMEYYLFTTPPKTVLNPEHALFQAELVPASLVHLGSSQNSGIEIGPEFLSKMSSHKAACEAAALIRSSSKQQNDLLEANGLAQSSTVVPSNRRETEAPYQEANRMQTSEPSTSTKVPKWFKGGPK